MQNHEKNTYSLCHIVIAVLAVVLMGLIVWMMVIVSHMQGTARVVNYAGLVRGTTQRMVKLEMAGEPQDEMRREIEAYIQGLREGDASLSLVRLSDPDFQDKMKELSGYYLQVKQEIIQLRRTGKADSYLIAATEQFFAICDEATALAEVYSEKQAKDLAVLEKGITLVIFALMILIGLEFFKALKRLIENRVLQKKAYLDAATGLPNKNRCEEILNAPVSLDMGVVSFDLNDLRRINDSRGHEAGDVYIRRFATALRAAVPEEHFVGRLGGDEFLMVTHGLSETGMEELLEDLRAKLAEEAKEHMDTPLSYAAGYVLAKDDPEASMRELFAKADKHMYIQKNHAKRKEAEAERRLSLRLRAAIPAPCCSSWRRSKGQTGSAYRVHSRRRRWRSHSFIGRMRWTFPLRRRRGRNYAAWSSFPWTLIARGSFIMPFLRFSTSAGRRMRLWGRRKRSPSTMNS